MAKRGVLLFTCLWLGLQILTAQNRHDFGFERSFELSFQDSTSQTLPIALAGGMNSVRFSQIDLNGDGVKDLVAFEKNGNRLLPFITQQFDNQAHYTYAPEFKHRFPDLHDWLILKDYDNDGLEDIFTYGNAGIRVFKNTTDENGLSFEWITDQLEADYYGGMANIFCSPDDYLAIEDIDGDGDLDILNFMVLGKFVHELRNYAVENQKSNGDFDFKLENECWGHFAEGADDNSIELSVDCNAAEERKGPTRHVGSTILVGDFNHDALPDVVIGDVDYPGLILLENGGTLEDAVMTSQTADFPNAENPVSLYSMPVISMLDLDADGKAELVVSPSDPSLVKSQNLNSVWLYHLDSLSDNYQLKTTAFLQNEMIDVGSGCYPIAYDWNQDGLEDLFLANFGRYDSSMFEHGFLTSYYSSSLAYYQNVGMPENPIFRLITNDFGELKKFGKQALYPVFADFDGDGMTDILAGNKDGNLLFFKNLNNNENPVFDSPSEYGGISVGQFSTPQYFDLDHDGKKDLIIGNRRGQLAYYRDISTTEIPDFEWVTNELGNVDVRDEEISYFGYSVPCFFKNAENETVLFCINEQGKIMYYKNIQENITNAFEIGVPELFEVWNDVPYPIAEGIRGGICVSDFNHDGYPDILIGNYAGGISYFKGILPPEMTISIKNIADYAEKMTIFPNPATEKISILLNESDVGTRKIQIFNQQGQLVHFGDCSKNPIEIETWNWQNGIYFVQVLTKESPIMTKKVMILH